MIITFAQQKGGVGKTTLAIAFANYLVLTKDKKVNIYDFDFQRSFLSKWEEDEELNQDPPLYQVKAIENSSAFSVEDYARMKESEEIFLFDLGGTINEEYMEVLMYSNILVVPFEYSEITSKSTMMFISMLGAIEGSAELVFLRSRLDKGYNYKTQEHTDRQLEMYGKILPTPIYKRNEMQNISTRRLTYIQKKAVKDTFEELIEYIKDETEQTAF
ncbi:MAG: ParA family protein [Capnocytophaga sp.]|nr:ParA family protein [Capnocytophaga sp.]